MTGDLAPLHSLLPRDLVDATADDRYFDYCLEPYRPRRPTAGKARAESLLWHSLRVAGQLDAWRAPLGAVQAHVGRDLTVWGVKWAGPEAPAADALWWELYFYDPQKQSPEATIDAVGRALRPFLGLRPQISETTPYMMFSFDLRRGMTTIDELNLYLTGQRAHAGRAYRARPDGIELDNTYRFMAPKREIDEVVPLLQSSVFVDYAADPRRLGQVLLPQLFACKKVCIAKKRHCDAIYFSGITVEQLLWFLRRFSYPAAMVEFVERHQARFEHLWFDVGIDYRWDHARDALAYPKTSFYGTL